MTLLVWRDEFRIGIDGVDYEHRRLIDLINEAHARSAGGEPLEAVLGEIHALISAHFALEETDMRSRGYHALDAHKADHELLLDELREIMEGVLEGPAAADANFGEVLAAWFAVHFRTHDAALHSFVAAASSSRTPGP
jgi:hemerythrin